MFLHESTVTTQYERKTKFGKLGKYSRTKTLTHWKCDNCGEEFFKIRNGKYNNNSKSFCKNCLSKIGLGKLVGQVGYEHKVEKIYKGKVGNIVTSKDGYPEVYIGANYPYRKGGYRSIREHIFVMECHLQRGLKKGEIVHHIDGDKKNNKIENLFLTNVAEHNKLHAESENIIFKLVKLGAIKFNRDTARYELIGEYDV